MPPSCFTAHELRSWEPSGFEPKGPVYSKASAISMEALIEERIYFILSLPV